MPIKCKCGFIWTDQAIKEGFEEDEISKFYRCPITEKEGTIYCGGLCYVSEEGGLWVIYQKLRKRHKEVIEKERIEKLQKQHKYTLDTF